MEDVLGFFTRSRYARRIGDPEICDFVAGNPHEMPLPGFVAALERWIEPRNKDWFAYKMSAPKARRVVAASLRRHDGRAFRPDDVVMTTGAFGALAVALATLVDPGDEVIYLSPPWFFYRAMIVGFGGTPVSVKVDPNTFEPDLEAIEAALSDRTRAIIVNSPNNPTGKVYSAEVLAALGELLDEASQANGRRIVLLSDDAYSRIVYDGRPCPSPSAFYGHSFLIYTYGKTLLTPGQRIGYIALPPGLPDRPAWAEALAAAQLVVGFAFPNALLQHALEDIDTLSIDLAALEGRRDRMVSALTGMGYRVHVPEGTFYLLPRSPLEDDWAFIDRLADRDVFCLPGSVVELPGWFRISLTANDAMVERALPGFESALAEVSH